MRYRIKTPFELLEFESPKEEISIGRSSENDFVVPLEDFSRKHCVITQKGGYYFIMDVGSKNGVIIDKKRIVPNQHYPIYQGSDIILANHFEFFLFDKLPDKSNIDKKTLSLLLDSLPKKF